MATSGRSSSLLAAAGSVLRQHQFDVQQEALHGSGASWLLAESELFIIAVAAAEDLKDLLEVESFAAPELVGRLRAAEGLGGKRWDAYLVLIASLQADTAEDARQLADTEYNTREVRRLVSVAVEPTEDDIRRVLRPFIGLPAPTPGGASDTFSELEQQLVVNGFDTVEAHKIVAAFQEKGHLGDV